MSDVPLSPTQNRRLRKSWRRFFFNILLLPPALLYVIIENVFWAGATRLLREAAGIKLVRSVQTTLEKLPPWAVLPLFLIPEIFSHIGGFWATELLVRRKWAAAMLAGLLIKGTATLIAVWIYQSCEKTLLSVKWFASLHGKFLAARDWVAERIKPARLLARRLIRTGRVNLGLRFRALRASLARRFNMPKR